MILKEILYIKLCAIGGLKATLLYIMDLSLMLVGKAGIKTI